jgi:molybdopterin molybdotransferase
MVSVGEAERIILLQSRDFGTELISYDDALGRVLAEDILADRDLPPYNRVTMDGIAINYQAIRAGAGSFKIKSVQSAGEEPIEIAKDTECIEIMTGAVLPSSTDTVIPYEEINIHDGVATINGGPVCIHQNIHLRGKDKRQNELLVDANQFITPVILTIAAAVGKTKLLVKKNPKIIIISTGDELVDIGQTPTAYQIRRSNNYTIRAVLKQYAVDADMLHLPDQPEIIESELKRSLRDYDIVILSGGVSMGKFDFVPAALEKLRVKKLFHKVQQRPGKPFWFGVDGKSALVFAFPGNPVSTFMCFHRYFLPWLKTSWQIFSRPSYAILNEDFSFKPALQYFLQVNLCLNENGQCLATAVEGNGSGDFANLLASDAFLELPLETTDFYKGTVFRVWPFKPFQQ